MADPARPYEELALTDLEAVVGAREDDHRPTVTQRAPGRLAARRGLPVFAAMREGRFSRMTRLGRMAAGFAGDAAVAASSAVTSGKDAAGEVLHKRAADRMLAAFSETRGLPLKAGQMLSYVNEFVPERHRAVYEGVLATLQAATPPLPWAEMSSTFHEDFDGRDVQRRPAPGQLDLDPEMDQEVEDFLHLSFAAATEPQPFRFTRAHTAELLELTMTTKALMGKKLLRGKRAYPFDLERADGRLVFLGRIVFGLASVLASLDAEGDFRAILADA